MSMRPDSPACPPVPLAIALALILGAPAAQADVLGCLITPSRIVDLGSATVGIVEKVFVERGDTVKANQVVVTLRADVQRAHANVAALRARADAESRAAERTLALAQRKLERARDLFRQEFVSAQAVDQALVEEHAARARKDQANEQALQAKEELLAAHAELEARTLRSPIAGVVVDVHRRVGERVEEKPVLKIATLDPLHAEVVLPAAQYGRLKTGMTLVVQPTLAGQGDLKGTVRVVDRVVDPASNTFRARVVLPNPEHLVPAGLRCNVALPADDRAPTSRPDTAAPNTAPSAATAVAKR